MEDLRTAENVNTFKLKALSLPFYFGSHLLGGFFLPCFIYILCFVILCLQLYINSLYTVTNTTGLHSASKKKRKKKYYLFYSVISVWINECIQLQKVVSHTTVCTVPLLYQPISVFKLLIQIYRRAETLRKLL